MDTKSVGVSLETNGETSAISLIGRCDILIEGLTAGTVSLQYISPNTKLFVDMPRASYTTDTYTAVFFSTNRKCRLKGTDNNLYCTNETECTTNWPGYSFCNGVCQPEECSSALFTITGGTIQ